MFQTAHPLYDSHYISLLPATKSFIPSFIGPGLPRPDAGDCEFYCSTILALFAPWRERYDLKNDNVSWDTVFLNYKFKSEHSAIIKNMNVRYECLDARDDFSAQHKQ
ncbi:hypothetical protein BDN67DRAFT_909129, partial [Paxillus ammoniavirescens]